METAALLARFRADTRDTVQPYLWSDEEALSYIDEAQNEFCRLTGGLADSTSSDVARVAVTSGQQFADLSPLILKIRAIFGEDGKPIEIKNFEDYEFSAGGGTELFADVPGPVRTAVVGMEPDKLKLINTPDADQTLNLIVYRLPLEPIEDIDCDLEVAAQHHLSLLMWARRMAHLKSDAETYDRGRADQFGQEFMAYCSLAKDEKARREHKYRAVQFSW